MRSSEHFLASVPVVALVLLSLREQCDRIRLALLGAYGLALGVGIDFDHFLLARVHAGDWRHLRYLLRNPIAALGEQEAIFEDVPDMTLQRLLTHALLGGALIGLTGRVAGSLERTTAVVLYWHVCCDLLRDNHLV